MPVRAYQGLLANTGVRCSMSRKGEYLDNAVAERFFGSLKGERTAHCQSVTRQDARADVIDYIEMFYNSTRFHSYLGYRSPNEYEALRKVASLSVRFYLTITSRDRNAGESRADTALARLEGALPWVWTAIDPVNKLLGAIEAGPRPVERAQRGVHRVCPRFAPGCVPAWLSDGFKGYLPALLGHCGGWVHPARRQDKGPVLTPR
jgi:Integrase core domain